VIDLSETEEPMEYVKEFIGNPKYKYISSNKWMTYNAAIKYAFNNIPKGELVAVTNNDIFLSNKNEWSGLKDMTRQLVTIHKRPVMYTLTRHEWGTSE